MAPTRRTHIVRCPLDDTNPDGDSIDIEVLDAIAFRGPNGGEMILKMPAADCVPYIVDETGGGHEKKPSEGTRRSHMKRITNGENKLDVEVLEVISFDDENGDQWILDMHATNGDPSVFNVTDGTGDNTSTRRTHNEKIYNPFGKKGDQFLTIERCDAMAFRTINGQELIIDCKSSDDQGSTDNRADTFVWSPKGYDPAKDEPKPPINKDPHNYIKGVKGVKTFLTGKELISMGPLWWIRKVNISGSIAYFTFEYDVSKDSVQPTEPKPTLTNLPWSPATFSVFSDIADPALNSFIPPVAVVNPVSTRMRASLNQWTPHAPYELRTATGGGGSLLYFVTYGPPINSSNYNQPYPATDQCGNPITYSGAYGGTFFRCNPVAEGEAAGNGFTASGILEAGSWSNIGDAQYVCNALNSLAFWQANGWTEIPVAVDIGSVAPSNRVQARAVFAVNIAKGQAKVADPNATTFTFKVRVPASPDGKWTLKGAAYKSKTDFPIDGTNTPTFDGFPQDTISGPPASPATVVTVTIDFKAFTVAFAVDP